MPIPDVDTDTRIYRCKEMKSAHHTQINTPQEQKCVHLSNGACMTMRVGCIIHVLTVDDSDARPCSSASDSSTVCC